MHTGRLLLAGGIDVGSIHQLSWMQLLKAWYTWAETGWHLARVCTSTCPNGQLLSNGHAGKPELDQYPFSTGSQRLRALTAVFWQALCENTIVQWEDHCGWTKKEKLIFCIRLKTCIIWALRPTYHVHVTYSSILNLQRKALRKRGSSLETGQPFGNLLAS